MPALNNPRSESFARLVAAGATLYDAYEDAGFIPGNRHAARLARRQEVALRIAELREEAGSLVAANGPAVVAGLLRIVKAGEELKTPAAMKEARAALVEAWKVCLETSRLRELDRDDSGLTKMINDDDMFSYDPRRAQRLWEANVA